MIRRRHAAAVALAVVGALSLAPGAAAEPEPVVPRSTGTPSGFDRIDVRDLHKIAGVSGGADPDRSVSALVELSTAPVAVRRARSGRRFDPAAASERVRASQDRAIRGIDTAGAQVYGRVSTVMNAVQVQVKVRDLPAVARASGVSRVHVSRVVHATNSASNAYTGVDRAWQSLGLAGKGEKIGVIDSGIDYTHADFGGRGTVAAYDGNDRTTVEPGTFPTARVVGGYDLVGDAFDGYGDDPAKRIPHPDPDPLDCNGHGTHVAGTAAGSGVTTDGKTYSGPYDRSTTNADFEVQPGAAPAAELYAYKVFGCSGSSSDDAVVAAIDRAVADGVDVVNMSLSTIYGTAYDPVAVAIANATDAGVTVVASAGNSGANAYVVGSPSTADQALSVAATENEFASYPGVRISGAATATGLVANGAVLPAGLTGTVVDAGLGCEASDYSAASGKVVVTSRGSCDRVDRVTLGQAAGATAVIMVNTDESLPPFDGPVDGVSIPFIGVPASAGPALRAAVGRAVSFTATGTVANPTFATTPAFTSGGPRISDSAQKPDLSAPGVSVPSASFGTGTGSIRKFGTSVASPHAAGIAALVHQAHPGWDASQVKAVLMSTAAPSRIVDYDSRRNGTGEVAAYAATRAQAYSWTSDGLDSIRFGVNEVSGARSERRTFHITNDSTKKVTYRLKTTFSGSRQGASVSISPRRLTVKAGKTRTVAVTLRLSRADVRRLPGAVGSDQGELSTIRGRIVATSSSSSAKRPDLQTTFLHVPVPLSDVRSSARVGAADGGGFSPIALRNRGVHSGDAKVFSWLLSDPAGDAPSPAMPDLTNVGVAVLPGTAGGGTDADRFLVFTTSEAYALPTQSYGETDVLLDVDGDRTVDYRLLGVDANYVGGVPGSLLSVLVDDTTGDVVAAYDASGPANGSTTQLPVLASDLGLTGSRPIGVGAVSYALYDPLGGDQVDGTAIVDPYAPALSSGQEVALAPGQRASVAVAADADADELATQTHLGWLVVTPDDRSGYAETDRVRLDLPDGPTLQQATAERAAATLRRG